MIQLEITTKIKMTPIVGVFLNQLAKTTYKALKLTGRIEVSLVFVGPQTIKRLNHLYRHQNKVTDVLSFEGLNEIFICWPQALKQSVEHQQSVNQEVGLLFVHGLLHLFGFDHKQDKEALIMDKLQFKILKKSKLA
jgi:probable rRNA maturation factor